MNKTKIGFSLLGIALIGGGIGLLTSLTSCGNSRSIITLYFTDGRSHSVHTIDDFNKLCSNSFHNTTITFDDGFSFVKDTLLSVRGFQNNMISHIPDYFLANCTAFNYGLGLPSSITSIGLGFLSGCTGFDGDISLSRTHITECGDGFLQFCSSFNGSIIFPSTMQKISKYFLYNCTSFNQPLTIPDSVVAIDNRFLGNASAFNSELILSNSLETLSNNFLESCELFNQPLQLPSLLNSIGSDFLARCDNLTSTINFGALDTSIFSVTSEWTFSVVESTADAYTTGMTIDGDNASGIKALFPDSGTMPYRKVHIAI
ncbi:MAG: leucine-rich repeat domain-containing protein [Mycoplasmataceae bacterium]|jgi:hypothetical protein|nr:leucine-rich repeat domain-containing protein [Mycoplasmataceae bacterium]